MKKLKIVGDLKARVTKNPMTNELVTWKVGNMLIEILNNPGAQGARYMTMIDRALLMKKILKAQDEKAQDVLIENAEHGLLVTAVNDFPFACNDPVMTDWLAAVVELDDVEVKETKETKKAKG